MQQKTATWGTYNLHFDFKTPQPQQQQQTVVIDSQGTADSELGSVSILCDDTDAELYVDAGFVGNSPTNFRLPEGVHIIEVKKGDRVFKREVRILANSQITIRAKLE